MTSALEPVDLASLGLGPGHNPASHEREGLASGNSEPGVEIFLDPVCPYSYLAFDALMRIVDDLQLSPTLQPLLLAGSDPMLSAAESRMHAQKLEAAWPGLRRLASTRFGVELNSVPWGARGAIACAALLWAGKESSFDVLALWRKLFEARFRDRLDIDDPTVVLRALSASKTRPQDPALSMEALLPQLEAGLEIEIKALRKAARQRSITAVPTMIIGGGHVVVGAQPASVLRETLSQLQIASALGQRGPESAKEKGQGAGSTTP